jgi:hypothetical protein
MRWTGHLGAWWGAAGVTALMVFAIVRLTPVAYAAYEMRLGTLHWVVAVVFVVLMAYAEGYRGFQQRFSPRTGARVRYLRDRPDVLRSLFAPLFAMGFFHANRRTKTVAYALSLGILTLVLLVRLLAQPWRGIIDMGVVVGLTWGTVSLVFSIVAALTRNTYAVSPEVD